MNRVKYRKLKSGIYSIILGIATLLALVPLISIFWYVLRQGISGLNLDFFTQLPAPVGVLGGGMGNAILGTLQLVLVSSIISIPIGIAVGVYLAEYGNKPLGNVIRFMTDVLSGVPSIVVGLLIYSMVVLAMGGFSGIAGSIALAIIMIPTVTRTTEQMIRLVPNTLRESSLGLGASHAQTLFRIVLPAASRGILTGVMLAVARVMGESAPLLFTSFGSNFWNFNLTKPTAALPLQIYVYAISPYPGWHQQAWAGALTLLGIVLLIILIARFLTRTKY